MCGRFTLTCSSKQVAEQFELDETPTLLPRYNIAPTQESPVVRVLEGSNRRELHLLRWGLIPHWSRDRRIGNRMINARSETVEEKPAFRNPFRTRRCLIPCSGFFEWNQTGSRKQPYYIRRHDGLPLAFAGLWDRWQDHEDGTIETFTILTTEPNELMRPLHNRMPVILRPSDYALWLDPTVREPDVLKPLLVSCRSDELMAFEVDTRINNPAYDDPTCIEPSNPSD